MNLFSPKDEIFEHKNYRLLSYPYWTLYVLKCENDVIYIGITTKSVFRRYWEHKRGKGALSTKLNKPITILRIISTEETDQSKMAINYENRYVRLCQVLVKNKKILGGHIKPSFYNKP
jgi:predicted GIY-YIG superfamily endonuclease